MKGFAPSQMRKLVQPLDPQRIQMREAQGRSLRYIEGWFAVQQANVIFGYAGWDREMVHLEKLYERTRGAVTVCAYAARIRIRVRAGDNEVVREGTGFGTACANDAAEAYERALKTAETDATKRALSTFGSRFGLLLYEKHDELRRLFVLRAADGAIIARDLSPEAFCSGLRQMVDACADTNALMALRLHNQAMIEALHRQVPELRSSHGAHYADILQSLITKRLLAFERKTPLEAVMSESTPGRDTQTPMAGNLESARSDSQASSPANVRLPKKTAIEAGSSDPSSTINDNQMSPKPLSATTRASRIGSGNAIEKSQLQLGSDRRIRNKVHLAYVASRPCLICEELPCHAHHVTFAQRRGLSQKVSDEFTVPLCALHHNAVHLSGSERAWWRAQGIEPLRVAAALWDTTVQNDRLLPSRG